MIVIIKATRKPLIWKNKTLNESKEANDLFNDLKQLESYNLTATGISVQIVDNEYKEQVEKIEIGGLELHGIKIITQFGGW